MEKQRLKKDELLLRKALAKKYYTSDGVTTQKELSERIGVSEKTIGKWISEEKWETDRAMEMQTKEAEKKRIVKQLTALNDMIEKREEGKRFPDSKEADTLVKLSTAISKFDTEINFKEIKDAYVKLINFARQENLEEAKVIMKWCDLLLKTLL
jgi:transposase